MKEFSHRGNERQGEDSRTEADFEAIFDRIETGDIVVPGLNQEELRIILETQQHNPGIIEIIEENFPLISGEDRLSKADVADFIQALRDAGIVSEESPEE